jgi:hypothetical protein
MSPSSVANIKHTVDQELSFSLIEVIWLNCEWAELISNAFMIDHWVFWSAVCIRVDFNSEICLCSVRELVYSCDVDGDVIRSRGHRRLSSEEELMRVEGKPARELGVSVVVAWERRPDHNRFLILNILEDSFLQFMLEEVPWPDSKVLGMV